MSKGFSDTICAPATIPGTGAISLIRISGPEAISVAGRILDRDISSMKGYSACFCRINDNDGALLDEVVVTLFRGPHSYTGEDSVEISCHSSSYIVSEILCLLIAAGARSADPGEFTQRAFINARMDLAQAEAVADVIASENRCSHRLAMNQLKGGISSELKTLRDKLLKMTMLMELELDFSEEEVTFADRGELIELLDFVDDHIKRLIGSFRLGNALKNGVPVVIAGSTNSGKSTLFNSLLQDDRAIVSDIAGTTRDTLEERLVVDSFLFRLIDTAGLRDTEEVIERMGIERSLTKVNGADIVMAVLDSSKDFESLLQELNDIYRKINLEEQYIIVILNKIDLLSDDTLCNRIDSCVSSLDSQHLHSYFLKVSSLSGEGVDEIKSTLKMIQTNRTDNQSSVLVTNLRHYEALRLASTSLSSVRQGLVTNVPTDLVSQDLREVLHHLGTITGDITTDEVLGTIFSNFCIGK